MRKKIMFGLLLMVVMVTGCGKGKTLTCTYKARDSFVDMNDKYTLKFDKKGENVNSITGVYTAIFLDYSDDEVKKEYEKSKEECDGFNKLKGISCKVSLSGKKLERTEIVNVSELDSSSKDEASLDDIENLTYENAKERFVDAGFTCK